MKKALSFFALSVLLSSMVFAQNYRDRHPFDFKRFNLGLQIGLTYNDYNLKEQVNIGEGLDTLRNIRLQTRPGINFGMIANMNLGRQLSLRMVPSISLEQRDIYYNIEGPEGPKPQTRKIDPAYFNIPLMFQWKTSYWKRTRFYVLTGGQVSVNMARNEKVQDNPELIKLSRYDGALVFGFGLNMYGDKVKFSPEIRYKLGLSNVYVPDNTTFAHAISRLSSQVISLNFNFE
ncbi:MAG: PorT family protein [Bacteroidia bacterium]|nr:PorT family protein [Bacteroidia bacterium]